MLKPSSGGCIGSDARPRPSSPQCHSPNHPLAGQAARCWAVCEVWAALAYPVPLWPLYGQDRGGDGEAAGTGGTAEALTMAVITAYIAAL